MLIDVAEPRFATRNLEFYRLDVRSPGLAEVVEGCDAVVHLAAAKAGESLESVNAGGTRNVAEAVRATNVESLVFASDAAVYGAHPDNPVPIGEDAPLRPSGRYGASKADAEAEVADACILRFQRILGPTVPVGAAGTVVGPLRLAVEGHDPPVQVVHEDDAARAILFALERRLRGTYNVSSGDWVARPEAVLGQRRVSFAPDQAERWRSLAARAGLGGYVPEEAALLMHPLVLSDARLREAGFEPRHTTAETLRAAAESGRGFMNVGGRRVRPRWLGAAAVGAAALAISSALRPKRARA